ncbi:MAG: type II secretion system protein GspG [Phycisphaerae bacterium]|nr:type II secretion system protein GspG [Phycisphaerae bacterium]
MTEANMRLMETGVRAFTKASGRLPTAREGLSVLVAMPADWPTGSPWTHFLETSDLPRDGWGRELVYVPDPKLPHGFGIYSCGEDGKTISNGNDRDDLNTWSALAPWRSSYGSGSVRQAAMRWVMLILAGVLTVAATVTLLRRPPFAKQQ